MPPWQWCLWSSLNTASVFVAANLLHDRPEKWPELVPLWVGLAFMNWQFSRLWKTCDRIAALKAENDRLEALVAREEVR